MFSDSFVSFTLLHHLYPQLHIKLGPVEYVHVVGRKVTIWFYWKLGSTA